MSATPKLTKKQKKSLAFREHKTSKRQPHRSDQRHKDGHTGMGDDAHFTLEDQDICDLDSGKVEAEGDAHEEDGAPVGYKEGNDLQCKTRKVGRKSKGETEKEDVPVVVAVLKGKKRRRIEEEEEDVGQGGTKKAKQTSSVEKEVDNEKKKDKTKQKFILFVGNLKYTTTKETIAQHFSLCDPQPTIRLLTPKANPGTTKPKLKTKGCAFLEFKHKSALQQALKLHQSNLDGRLINVELTAGGGGKSESRLAKVRERNKALLGQREKRTIKEGETEVSLAKPQRFSTTSGSIQKPTVEKTWTVGDTDDGRTHRGVEKLRKRSKSRQRSWGTGVNAIPL